MNLSLQRLPGRYAVCRLDGDAALPAWAVGGALLCVTRTAQELSLVLDEALVPADVRGERDFVCVQVAGVLDFALTGVLAALATPLAQAGVSIFAISTFDTDYLLLRAPDWQQAVQALTEAGHTLLDDQVGSLP